MNLDIGKPVTVTFPHYKKVKRILHEDKEGLCVHYAGQRVSVRPDTNSLGEPIRGYYIGLHPKVSRNLEGR